MSRSVPNYRRQRRKGRSDTAFTEIGGKRIHLGVYDSKESRQRYAELLATDSPPKRPPTPSGPTTINMMLVEFLKHAKMYYVDRNGDLTREHGHYIEVARLLRKHGREIAEDFGPKKLKAIRDTMIEKSWSRTYVNGQVHRIVRIFKWAVADELIPAAVHTALATVDGLRRGKTIAKEGTKRKPVPVEDVMATVKKLPQVVADMVLVQLYAGMRPGEVMIMRPCDIDRRGDVWAYTPEYHKTEVAGCDRVIAIGPRAQSILLSYLACNETAYLFSPADSESKRLAEREANRETPESCGNRRGTNRKKAPKQQPGDRYHRHSYAQAIRRAAKRAGVSHWTPYQLRHTQGTEARKLAGLDATQSLLGHKHASTTERYAQPDISAAAEVARKIG